MDPAGVLYLTDQRLLFEQKEGVVAKKVLFVTTDKKKVQQTQLVCPLSLLQHLDADKQGLLKNEDHIGISFGSGAPVTMAQFHNWQDGSAWQALTNRAISKYFDGDRAALVKVKAAPAQCPSCGGNLTKPVLRGQDSITREYCGFVIRL